MMTLEGPGTEQGPPASGVPGALGEGGGLSPRGTLTALMASPSRRATLHGRHHHLGEGQVEGVGSPGDTWGVQELVWVDDACRVYHDTEVLGGRKERERGREGGKMNLLSHKIDGNTETEETSTLANH